MQVSFWEKQSFYAHKDVIVVGAGLAGLWSAYELYKLDNTLKILILERGVIPQGASTRNAGFACFGSPTELLNDCHVLGENKMWEVTEMRYKGIQKIKTHFNEHLIEWDSCGGYELLKNGYEGAAELDEKLRWLNKGLEYITGLQQTFIRKDDKLNSLGFMHFAGLVENPLEAGFNSGKLVQALTKMVLGVGIEILNSAAVTQWEIDEIKIKIEINNQIILTANKLLFCTNAFTSELLKDTHVTPARGQILLTAPIERLGFNGTFHYDEGYYYFRNVGNRVLIGGARNQAFEEETTTELETTVTVQNELERFLREHILTMQKFTIEQRWSGVMGFTKTKLPEVKQVAPNVFALITCNGMGVALAPIMAERAAAAVLR